MAETGIAGPSNAPSSENVTTDHEAEELKKDEQELMPETEIAGPSNAPSSENVTTDPEAEEPKKDEQALMPETEIAGPSNAPSSDFVTDDHEAVELKEELQRLVMEVIGGHQEDNDGNKVDHGVGNINKAIKALTELKQLHLGEKKRQLSSLYDHLDVPVEYRCPISKEMMRDPVVLSTGQTYDRPSIYKWLKDVHQICPQTREVLSHAVLTPNHLVRELIQQWCKDNGIQLPPPIMDLEEQVVVTNSDEDYLNGLLHKLSTLSDQKQAAKEIRLMTKSKHPIRPYFSESEDAISQLLNPLSLLKDLYDHPDLQGDLVTILLNISLHDGNKKRVSEHPLVIPFLIESLTRGTIDTRANAAAALSALSSLDSNKKLIGEAGALKPLIDLLVEDHDHPSAMSDSASAIFQLCGLAENKRRLVSGGAVRVILQKMQNGGHVDRLLTIMALLATHPDAIKELVELRAVKFLLEIIRVSTCERTNENGIAIVFLMCRKNRAVLEEVGEEEKVHGTISKLEEQGSERAKRKAISVWNWLFDADIIRAS
ncbi:U-box domain-containing protein 9-like [Silene latifolia]|uniref:U-box domain-containing protein 9-like n=1 Tax=Silene latifolia TaxID=37657 RepID=UPI003D783AD0